LLRQLDTACANAEDLAAAATRFAEHPDAAIITSTPGLAELTGARVLAEIGDDRTRFADARGLTAYAGSSPVTSASRKSTAVLHRRVKNQRLASVGYVWAFSGRAPPRTTRCAHCCASSTPPSSRPSRTSAAGCCVPRVFVGDEFEEENACRVQAAVGLLDRGSAIPVDRAEASAGLLWGPDHVFGLPQVGTYGFGHRLRARSSS
jgi:transposase IS116/IS110/IS902 family protein